MCVDIFEHTETPTQHFVALLAFFHPPFKQNVFTFGNAVGPTSDDSGISKFIQLGINVQYKTYVGVSMSVRGTEHSKMLCYKA